MELFVVCFCAACLFVECVFFLVYFCCWRGPRRPGGSSPELHCPPSQAAERRQGRGTRYPEGAQRFFSQEKNHGLFGPLTLRRSGRLFLRWDSGDAAGAGVDLALLCVSVLLVPRRALVAREGCVVGTPPWGRTLLLSLVVRRCVFAAHGVDALPEERRHALYLQEPRSHVQDVFHL